MPASTTAGAVTTVDGIIGHPHYAFDPPLDFFAAGPPPAGPHVYNVADFGAVPDPAIDNAPMIQAAIDAAHAAGGGIVYLPPGVYGIVGTNDPSEGGVRVLDNVFLKGAGIGVSSLRVVDGFDKDLTGIVRTPTDEITKNWGVADLSLDGNREHNPTGKIDAFFCGVQPDDPRADEDGYVLRVEALNNRGYGFDPHEQTIRLTIKDSVAHHNGLDGFTEDFMVDGVFSGNLAYANDRHGFNITTTTNDCLFRDNIARDNGGAGFTIQRGSFDIPSPHNIVIQGGEVSGNKLEGINIRMSHDVVVRGVNVHDNGTYGVRLNGSSHVTLEDNVIAGNAKTTPGAYAEVVISEVADALTGTTFHGDYNLIDHNTLTTATSTGPAGFGIMENGALVDHNVITGNVMQGVSKSLFKLTGAHTTVDQLGSKSADTIVLGGGNDRVDAAAGDDKVLAGDGDDIVYGGAGDDALDGGAGNDQLYGGTGNDRIIASLGNDLYDGGAGVDQLDLSKLAGQLDVDVSKQALVVGGTATSRIISFEKITGNDAGDHFMGGAGNDWFLGGKGADWFRGGLGADKFTGGAGADTFVWLKKDVGTAANIDKIADFQLGIDKLDLSDMLKGLGLITPCRLTDFSDIVHLSATKDHGTKVEVLVDKAWHDLVILEGIDSHHVTVHDLGLG